MATQLISKEEAAALGSLPLGKKHAVRILIEKLQPGQVLRVSREDFKWKAKTPNFFCLQISKAGKARFKTFKEPGKDGWVVERIK